MVKICELSVFDRELLVDGINTIMKDRYNIDQESINDFWNTFMTGTEMKQRA